MSGINITVAMLWNLCVVALFMWLLLLSSIHHTFGLVT